MARIGHRCRCGHTDLEHPDRGDGKHRCQISGCSGRRCTDLAKVEAEVFPTFDAKGQSVERIIPPGNKIAADGSPGGSMGATAHACDSCTALYDQLTQAA